MTTHVVTFGVLLTALLSPGAQESRPASQSRPAPEERVWEGYLFQDREGRVQLGWPVIAMGVMAQPAQLVAEPLAGRLAPLVSKAKENWFFLNYELEKSQDLDQFPRYLVTLRGRVRIESKGENPRVRSFPPRDDQILEDARVVEVEPLQAPWLEHWRLFFRDERSPFRIGKLAGEDKARMQEFAGLALAALQRMRAVPPVDAPAAKRLAETAPGSRLVDKFRRSHETSIQRWLVETCAKEGWTLPGLSALPPLPPTSVEIQRWFLEAGSKAQFLAKVAAAWKGEADDLELPHYVGDDGRSSYATTWLRVVREDWSDARFAANQALTKKILGGR